MPMKKYISFAAIFAMGLLVAFNAVCRGAELPTAPGQTRLGELGPGDMVTVQVFGQPDITSIYVGEDGTIDLRRQLLDELQEELGLPPDMVSEPLPLCIVEHPGSHVADFGLALVTGLGAAAVLEAQCRAGNAEYEQILVVSEAELANFLAETGEGEDKKGNVNAALDMHSGSSLDDK